MDSALMPRRPCQRETVRLLAYAVERGWTVIETKKGWKILSPDGSHTLMVHGTMSRPELHERRLKHIIDRSSANDGE